MRRVMVVIAIAAIAIGVFLLERAQRRPARSAVAVQPPVDEPARFAPRGPRAWPLRVGEGQVARAADEVAEIAGEVRSAASGAPIAGAELVFAHEAAAVTLRSDARGAFRLAPPVEGRWELLSATAREHLPFSADPGESPITVEVRRGLRVSGVTLVLQPAVEYVAEVRDAAGKPIAGARITRLEPALAGEPAVYTSDAHGEARVHAPDGAVFEATHAGYAPARAALDLSAQGSHRLTFVLAPGEPPARRQVRGRVVGSDGKPIAEARIDAHHKDGSAPHPSAHARADGDGRFVLDGLDAGDWVVAARAAGHAAAEVEAPEGTAEIVITLGAGGRVRGRVLDRSGAPIPSFTIVLYKKRGPLQRGESEVHAFVDGDGRFAVEDLAPGTWVVSAAASGHAPSPEQDLEIPAPPAEASCTLTLGRGARLEGTVTDRVDRSPLAGARVSLEGLSAETEGPLPLTSAARTDERGHFVLEGLSPGTRSILAAADGHHGRLMSGVRIPDEGDAPSLDIDLARTEPGEAPRIEFVGIGLVMSAGEDALSVVKVIAGGGAEAAGIQAGDRVLAIDGTPAVELGFAGAIERIRGPEGTIVVMRTQRGEAAPVDLPVTRKRINAK